jgi:hypothetical protein
MSTAEITALKKAVESLKDENAELRMRMKAVESGQVAETTEKVTKGKTAKAKKETDPDAPKRAPSSWAIALKEVYMPVINKALGDEKLPKGITHMGIAGYLKKQGKTAPSETDVKKAIDFMESNPDYKSDTQKTRSESGSVKEEKKRGRPAKAKAEKDAKPVPKVVTPKAETVDDEEEKQEEEEEEEEFQPPKLLTFNYKGVDYLRDPEENDLYTSNGDMQWVGMWTGKKIVKGEMSERVKKVLASQE